MLQRVTGNPSISIDAPAESFVSATETITVTGTVGAGVVTVDVNGVAATITGSPFTAQNVHLAPGLNIVVAHGRNAAGRTASASRRVTYAKDPPAISVSAPSATSTTGAATITVSGTYTNVDPPTIAVTNPAGATTQAQFTKFSDTTGSFTASVPLAIGDQTLRVAGPDRLNREASATVAVTRTAGAPAIAIAQPLDHAYFGAGSDSTAVSGTIQAAAGSTVDVNGVAATVTGSSFSGTAKFSTLAGGITPIVARVTEPAGASASATVVVTQLAAAPSVVDRKSVV